MDARTFTERRPGIAEGSIHCPVRQMKHYITQARAGYHLDSIVHMIKQLREGYADPTRSERERAEYVWLGRRYQEAYSEITGAPLPKGA